MNVSSSRDVFVINKFVLIAYYLLIRTLRKLTMYFRRGSDSGEDASARHYGAMEL